MTVVQPLTMTALGAAIRIFEGLLPLPFLPKASLPRMTAMGTLGLVANFYSRQLDTFG